PRNEVLFVHQLFQEYFAARRLARAPQPALVQQAWWAAEVVPSLQDTLKALEKSAPLPPLESTRWEETTVMAASLVRQPADSFVAALIEPNLALAGRCATQPGVQVSEALKERLYRDLMQRMQDPDADLRARLAAWQALVGL